MDLVTEKKELRRQVLKRRRGLLAEERQKKSQAMLKRLYEMAVYQQAKCIFCYASMKDEVQLYDFMQNALKDGKRLCLPHITGKSSMEAVGFRAMADLVKGEYDILTVAEDKRQLVLPAEIDLVIVPGVAFTLEGKRLGMGAGYYDRFLAKLKAFKVALTFDCQLVENIPTDEYDVPVDLVITESMTGKLNKDKKEQIFLS